MATEVFMPKMSDHMESGEIVQWLVHEGDEVREGQALLEINTDKVVAQVESPASGVLKGIRQGAQEGAVISVGQALAFVADPEEQVPVLPALTVQPNRDELGTTETAKSLQPKDDAQDETSLVKATPVARRLARELEVDLGKVKGSGPGGRIREEDIRRFVESESKTDKSTGYEIPFEMLALTATERITAQRITESVQSIPQFSLWINVDMNALLLLKDHCTKKSTAEEQPSVTAFIVRLVAVTLPAFLRLNSSYQRGAVKQFRQINVGVALATDDGLFVPVIREANEKPIVQIARLLNEFRRKAENLKLTDRDLSGGTFTISNLGMFGIDGFSSIINPPQSAILSIGRIIRRPVVLSGDKVGIRSMMRIALTVDHRCVDGRYGAQFLSLLKKRMEEPEKHME